LDVFFNASLRVSYFGNNGNKNKTREKIIMSLYEYIKSINQMLEAAKEESSEVYVYLDDLESLFLK